MRRDAGEVLPDALVAQIYNRTSGVPLLVEEFSRLACESAMFEPARMASVPGAVASARELPATLQELVMARLDRMSVDRDIAQLAATLGREVDYALLAAVVTVDEQTLRAELAKLVSAGIIYAIGRPPECVYLFKHVLIEEALYSAVSEHKRRRFHQQVAEIIEAAFYDENNIPYGDSFAQVLESSLESGETAALIAVVGDAYASRPWCRRELRMFCQPKCIMPEPVENRTVQPVVEVWARQPVLVVDVLEGKSLTRGLTELATVPVLRCAATSPNGSRRKRLSPRC
jgi:hypothetical protein